MSTSTNKTFAKISHATFPLPVPLFSRMEEDRQGRPTTHKGRVKPQPIEAKTTVYNNARITRTDFNANEGQTAVQLSSVIFVFGKVYTSQAAEDAV